MLSEPGWHDVRIAALCCFDTVRSLGMPLTGLARPLAFLKGARRHNHDIVSDVPGSKSDRNKPVASVVTYPLEVLTKN